MTVVAVPARVTVVTIPTRVAIVAVPAAVAVVVTPMATVTTTMVARVTTVRGCVRNKIITALILRNRELTRRVTGSHCDTVQGERVIIAFLYNKAVATIGVLGIRRGKRRFTGIRRNTELGLVRNTREFGVDRFVRTIEEKLFARLGVEGNRHARCQEARVHRAVSRERNVHRIFDVDASRLAAERGINQIHSTVAIQARTSSHENIATIVFNGEGTAHDINVAELNCRRRVDDDGAVLKNLESAGREDRRAFAGLAGRCRDVERAVPTDCQARNSRRTRCASYGFNRGGGARSRNGNVMICRRRRTGRPVLDVIKVAASATSPISRSHVTIILHNREQSRRIINQPIRTELFIRAFLDRIICAYSHTGRIFSH